MQNRQKIAIQIFFFAVDFARDRLMTYCRCVCLEMVMKRKSESMRYIVCAVVFSLCFIDCQASLFLVRPISHFTCLLMYLNLSLSLSFSFYHRLDFIIHISMHISKKGSRLRMNIARKSIKWKEF